MYRPHRSTPRGRRTSDRQSPNAGPAVPHSLAATMSQAQAVIAAQQRAIESLQANMASLSIQGNVTRTRGPLSTAPEKCELEMSSAAFRSWRRSMVSWLHLSKWTPQCPAHQTQLCTSPSAYHICQVHRQPVAHLLTRSSPGCRKKK